MPEGDTIWRTANQLRPRLAGKRLTRAAPVFLCSSTDHNRLLAQQDGHGCCERKALSQPRPRGSDSIEECFGSWLIAPSGWRHFALAAQTAFDPDRTLRALRLNRCWIPVPWVESSGPQHGPHNCLTRRCRLRSSPGRPKLKRNWCAGGSSPPLDEAQRRHAVTRLRAGDRGLSGTHRSRELCLSLARAFPRAGKDKAHLGFGHRPNISNWQYTHRLTVPLNARPNLLRIA